LLGRGPADMAGRLAGLMWNCPAETA
jgi:hypothetical protein